MASRGQGDNTVSSSMDGLDHSYRQKVASHYQASALNKSRLKYCIFFHYIAMFAMLGKLAPCILDRLNWFILVIEELEVPEPDMWEWIWLTSILMSIFCLDAIKKNSITSLRNYMIGITVMGVFPILYAMIYWGSDVWVYLFSDDLDDLDDVVYWKDYPYGLLWYSFIFCVLQVHGFSLYFSYQLMSAWKVRGNRRAE